METINAVKIVLEKIKYLPVLEHPLIISIDGRAAAGKTTLAKALSQELRADVVQLDDFFLPADLRSAERYAEVGGNVHYERFAEEVLPYLSKAEAFSYRRFSCAKMAYKDRKTIESPQWRIVEGCYSLRSGFGKYYDFSIFCDINPEKQMQRIMERNGPEQAIVFKERWIPLEERYLQSDKVAERADLILRA